MKTILHRGDRCLDGKPCEWSIKTMLYYRYLLRSYHVKVRWNKANPQALEIEADRLFGPELLMSHEDMMRLALRVEFLPSE